MERRFAAFSFRMFDNQVATVGVSRSRGLAKSTSAFGRKRTAANPLSADAKGVLPGGPFTITSSRPLRT